VALPHVCVARVSAGLDQRFGAALRVGAFRRRHSSRRGVGAYRIEWDLGVPVECIVLRLSGVVAGIAVAAGATDLGVAAEDALSVRPRTVSEVARAVRLRARARTARKEDARAAARTRSDKGVYRDN